MVLHGLNPADPYSSMNKGRVRNHTYGGAHHNSLTERGDNHISTLVTNRPWLMNTYDVSPVTRHDKPWNTRVTTVGRLYEPHFKQYGPPIYSKSGHSRSGFAYLVNR